MKAGQTPSSAHGSRQTLPQKKNSLYKSNNSVSQTPGSGPGASAPFKEQNISNTPNHAPNIQNALQSGQPQKNNSKVMITGDDILIEYVSRLTATLSNLQEDLVNHIQLDRMEKFISHYVWHLPDLQEAAVINSDSPM